MNNEIGNLCMKYGTYIFDSLFKDINSIKGKLAKNKDAIKTLVDILKSDAIVKYINDTYNGSVIPFK